MQLIGMQIPNMSSIHSLRNRFQRSRHSWNSRSTKWVTIHCLLHHTLVHSKFVQSPHSSSRHLSTHHPLACSIHSRIHHVSTHHSLVVSRLNLTHSLHSHHSSHGTYTRWSKHPTFATAKHGIPVRRHVLFDNLILNFTSLFFQFCLSFLSFTLSLCTFTSTCFLRNRIAHKILRLSAIGIIPSLRRFNRGTVLASSRVIGFTVSPIGDFSILSIIPSPKWSLQSNPTMCLWIKGRTRSPDHDIFSRILNRRQIGTEQLLTPFIRILPVQCSHDSDIVSHHVNPWSFANANPLFLALDIIPLSR